LEIRGGDSAWVDLLPSTKPSAADLGVSALILNTLKLNDQSTLGVRINPIKLIVNTITFNNLR
jgi:hypothetical protein